MLPLQNVSTTKILATTRPNLSSFCRIITGQMSSVGCMGQTGGSGAARTLSRFSCGAAQTHLGEG